MKKDLVAELSFFVAELYSELVFKLVLIFQRGVFQNIIVKNESSAEISEAIHEYLKNQIITMSNLAFSCKD